MHPGDDHERQVHKVDDRREGRHRIVAEARLQHLADGIRAEVGHHQRVAVGAALRDDGARDDLRERGDLPLSRRPARPAGHMQVVDGRLTRGHRRRLICPAGVADDAPRAIQVEYDVAAQSERKRYLRYVNHLIAAGDFPRRITWRRPRDG